MPPPALVKKEHSNECGAPEYVNEKPSRSTFLAYDPFWSENDRRGAMKDLSTRTDRHTTKLGYEQFQLKNAISLTRSVDSQIARFNIVPWRVLLYHASFFDFVAERHGCEDSSAGLEKGSTDLERKRHCPTRPTSTPFSILQSW
jgi:hypothetical protein